MEENKITFKQAVNYMAKNIKHECSISVNTIYRMDNKGFLQYKSNDIKSKSVWLNSNPKNLKYLVDYEFTILVTYIKVYTKNFVSTFEPDTKYKEEFNKYKLEDFTPNEGYIFLCNTSEYKYFARNHTIYKVNV